MQKKALIKKISKILSSNSILAGKSYNIMLGLLLDRFLNKLIEKAKYAKKNHVMVKFIFYVPESHLEKVKDAVSAAGAGQYGNYKDCFWQTLGQTQFKPLEKSEPYISSKDHITFVDEYRVETICPEFLMGKVIDALKKAHPYEEPVYDAWLLTHHSSI